MNHFKKYIVLIGSLILILFIGYFLINIGTTNDDSKETTSPKTSPSSNLSIVETDSISEKNNLKLTENDTKSKISLPENNTKLIVNQKSSKNEINILEQVDNISSLDQKVNSILYKVLPQSSYLRSVDLDKFNTLLYFAYENFNKIIPSDKMSEEFINLCNIRNELFHQLKKSKINFDTKKIDQLCLQ